MNGAANCILAVCCDVASERRVEMLAAEFVAHCGVDADSAARVARHMCAAYDLAPPGSLQAFKDAIRDLAREGYVKKGPR